VNPVSYCELLIPPALPVSARCALELRQAIASQREFIRPAAQRVGIQKRFGWHTFRRSYSTLLRSVGTEFKVMQELLRHSSFRSTLDAYTQAVTPAKHAAQVAVISLVFSSGKDGTALVAG
jgi:integrase